MLCQLKIWVLELLMRFADIFTRKYRPVNLFTEYFKIECFHTCRGLYSFVLPLSSPKKTQIDAIQTLFT